MKQGSFVSEDTQDLLRRAQQTLGEVPVLDLTNWQDPRYMSGNTIRSLGSSCHSITIRNIITVTDTSIVSCTGLALTTCGGIPTDCSGLGDTTPDLYYNFVATVNAHVAQTGVDITFKYVENGIPKTKIATVSLAAGTNTVYAFATNQTYPPDTELVLYGADVTKY